MPLQSYERQSVEQRLAWIEEALAEIIDDRVLDVAKWRRLLREKENLQQLLCADVEVT